MSLSNLIRQKLAVQAFSLLSISIENDAAIHHMAERISSQAVDNVHRLMLQLDCDPETAINMLGMSINTLLPKNSKTDNNNLPIKNIEKTASVAPSPAPPQNHETTSLNLDSPANPIDGELILAEQKTKKTKNSCVTALYPHHPPQNVDLHQRALLKTGLFRVLNKTLPRPMLDHNAIFRLDKPLVGGFSYMKMKGPVLDPDDDLITYLCIVNILGRLSDEEYSHATLHGIHLTMEEFMSPVRQLLSDNEKERFKQERRWRTSLERLRDVSFVFSESELGARASWDETNTFRAQEGFLLVSLISGITGTRDDELVITPSKELRELYRVSVGNSLAPLNPGLVMKQDGQFTRLLIMWIVGQGGNYNQRTGWFDLDKNITVKELLSEVKFKAKYHQTDLLQLSFGLNELVQDGLLRYEIVKKNQKKVSSNTISLSSIIQFKNHKLGDKQLDHKPDDNINLLKTTKDISVGEVTKIYRTLNFYIGGDVTMRQERLRNWDTKNRAVILEIMSRFKSVIDPKDLPFSLREARLLMTGLSSKQRYQLEEIMQRHVSPDDFKLFQQILATDPRKMPNKQGKIETLLRQIQTLTQAGNPENWLKQNNAKVELLIRELQNNQDSMKEFATLGKQLVTGRLITPLTKTGQTETAKLLSFFNVKTRQGD